MFLGVDSGSQSPEAVSAPQEHFELHVTVPSRRVLNWKCIFFLIKINTKSTKGDNNEKNTWEHAVV